MQSNKAETKYNVYILRCADSTLYTGSTNDLTKRLHAHNHTKQGAKYTRGRRPVQLLYSEYFLDAGAALKREAEIKKMTRQQKLKLINKQE